MICSRPKVESLSNSFIIQDPDYRWFFLCFWGKDILAKVASDYGVYPEPVGFQCRKMAKENQAFRELQLYDYYGGSMPSGWVKWMLEQFHFDYSWFSLREINEEICLKNMMSILFIEP